MLPLSEVPSTLLASSSASFTILPFLNGEEDELISSVGVVMDDNVREISCSRWLIAEELRLMKVAGTSDEKGSVAMPKDENTSRTLSFSSALGSSKGLVHSSSSRSPPIDVSEREGLNPMIVKPYLAWKVPHRHSLSDTLRKFVDREACENQAERQYEKRIVKHTREKAPSAESNALNRALGEETQPKRKRQRGSAAKSDEIGTTTSLCDSAKNGSLPLSRFSSLTMTNNDRIAVDFESLLSDYVWCTEGEKECVLKEEVKEDKKVDKSKHRHPFSFFFFSNGDAPAQHLQRTQERISAVNWMTSTVEGVRLAEQQEFLKQLSLIRDTQRTAQNTVSQLKKKCREDVPSC